MSIAIGKMLDQSGYLQDLRDERSEDAEARIENLAELVSAAREYESREPEPSLGGFVDRLSLLSDVDEEQGTRDARVWMMTLHSAKGLEFPVVILAGLEEGLFPHSRSSEDEEELEEERRLCYVGMTRARSRLVLTGAARRRVFGEYQVERAVAVHRRGAGRARRAHRAVVLIVRLPGQLLRTTTSGPTRTAAAARRRRRARSAPTYAYEDEDQSTGHGAAARACACGTRSSASAPCSASRRWTTTRSWSCGSRSRAEDAAREVRAARDRRRETNGSVYVATSFARRCSATSATSGGSTRRGR